MKNKKIIVMPRNHGKTAYDAIIQDLIEKYYPSFNKPEKHVIITGVEL